MGRSDHFLNILPSLDETYFIAMSNKGTYKRAVKDLAASPNVNIDTNENEARVRLADGTIVTFTDDIRTYSCTCGARTVCKHVMMALLAAKETIGESVQTAADFSALLHVDIHRLISEKMWGEILFRQTFQPQVVFEEGAVLIASFPEEEITVRFLTAESIEGAICTCKGAGICRHKAEAVYLYQKEKGMLHEKEQAQPLIMLPEKLAPFKEIIERIVHLGLSRLPEHFTHELERLSVKARALKLAKLENLFRKLAADIGLYRSKHAAFQASSYRKTLAAIYEYVLLLERQHVQEQAYRTDYYEVPPLLLHGFGASGWQTKSGYAGVTYYFYHEATEKWITYTQSRPLFYEGQSVTADILHEKEAPWGTTGTGVELSRSVLRLKMAKLNSHFQLSSSTNTAGEVEGKTNINKWESLFLTSWEELLEKVKQHERTESKQTVFCIETAETGEWSFHEQKLIWIVPLIDKLGKTLHMQLIKRPETERMMTMIKRQLNSQKTMRLLVHCYEENGQLLAAPVVLYTEAGDMINLTLYEGGKGYERDFARHR